MKVTTRLKYIRSTDKTKYVCMQLNFDEQTKYILYVLNKEAINDNTFDPMHYPQNKTAFKTTDDDNIILHNMYDTQKMFYKSAIYDKSKSIRDGTTYDFKNIFAHTLSSSLSNIVQVNNTLYACDNISPYGHVEISSDIYSYLSNDNGALTLPNKTIETYLYDRNVISSAIQNS